PAPATLAGPFTLYVIALAMSEESFPCPSCGFFVFGEPPGSYEICDLCGWEDDHVQLAHPAMGGGANKRSLVQSQLLALQRFPVGVSVVGTILRAPGWRPLRPEEIEPAQSPANGLAYFDAAAGDATNYYWVRDAAL
ncbi:CPCC family cysteine-rich protein, partial [Roseateles cavernae]|uniref:CPCC family cysteine-rich protein n=1 Tax=Roseateles cavernae TaxID=3153578 RepID=UPI0032E4A984